MLVQQTIRECLMARPKGQRQAVRLSVTLDERDHATIQRLAADLNLSTAWLIRRAVSEFVVRHGDNMEPELPLGRPDSKKS
ncbi:ribbon-helix-helix domain-containing protein [Mesorhizobium sp.]|uniref:ribbon-helix-helix domain-containing protein n=1 Tax=Mesorhizobium sp. TaxID=1871066 RepID=UPI0011F97D81|nr:MAG: CopG family transcriptional regulator [Mesorhizobium sp.]